MIVFGVYNLAFTGRIYPNVFVAGINLGGKTETEALITLNQKAKVPDKITLAGSGQVFEITPSSIDLKHDVPGSVRAALDVYRTGNIFLDLGLRATSF